MHHRFPDSDAFLLSLAFPITGIFPPARFVVCMVVACVLVGGARFVRAELPPFVAVAEHGGVDRERFPVQGGVPLPPGTLDDVSTLRLLDAAGEAIPAQFGVNGRWPDGSVKWVLLNFPSRQKARSTKRYRLVTSETPGVSSRPLAETTTDGVVVDTGSLRARFGRRGSSFAVRGADGTWRQVARELVSRIHVRERDQSSVRRYELPLEGVEVETNGHQRAVLAVRGWHVDAENDTCSPTVVRLSFYRDQPFVRVDHTFVVSKNPDTHLISDVALDLQLAARPSTAVFATARSEERRGEDRINLGTKRVAVFQENLYRPGYPRRYEDREFEGRYRVFHGDEVVARGATYDGGVTLEGRTARLGVYVSDFWQLSPKAVTYEPEKDRLRIGLYPGEFAGALDLMRTEIRNPEHYRKYREHEKESWGKYDPTYVPHDLVHSAMGISRTHSVVLWFGADGRVPGPIELKGLFEAPFVPFVSGEWNVSTGVLGKEIAPGAAPSEAETTARRMVDEQRRAIEDGGWYGLFTYGNVRYGWDKTRRRWMKYNPKYAWYHAGHMMSGGTLQQALWHHYLRSGDPRDYRLAQARGRHVMDVTVTHYHDQKEWVGSMLRHGGPDPWVGRRKLSGGHYPMAGLPIHYYVTGYERAADVVHLLGKKNHGYRDFDLGRNQDTNLANMTLYYEFTLDRRYLDRAAESVDHYFAHRDEAARDLTFFNYFTTAARWFYRVCDEPPVRQKLRAAFLARYRAHLKERRVPGNPEMAAFAYELEPGPEAARRVSESVESFIRQGSGQIGWYDNMLLVSPNELALINAVAYAKYWLSRIEGGRAARPGVPAPADETGGAIQANFTREGLAAWYRSDRGVRLVEGRVVQWDDQSGNGRHALAGRRWGRRGAVGGLVAELPELRELEESAPLLVPGAVQGLPVLRGERGRYLRLRRYVPLTGDCTVFFVCSAEAGDSGPVLGDGDDGDIRIKDVPRGSLSVRFNVGVPDVRARLRREHPPGGFSRWAVARKDESAYLYQDGHLLGVKRLEAVTPMNVEVLLGRRVWADFFRSELCELLIYDRCLSDAERATVDTYLSRRYGRLDLVVRPTGAMGEESEESGESGESGESEVGSESGVADRLLRSRSRLQKIRERLEEIRRRNQNSQEKLR